MPNIEFSDTKGLIQQTGTGVTFASSTVEANSATLDLQGTSTLKGHSRNLIVSSSTAYPTQARLLTAAEAGTIVFLDNQTTATTITLPAGSTMKAGGGFTFVVASNNTSGFTITRGTDGELIVGGFPIYSTTADNTTYAVSTATNDTLVLDSDNASGGGAIGTFIDCVWDGARWVADGIIVSTAGNPNAAAGAGSIFTNP